MFNNLFQWGSSRLPYILLLVGLVVVLTAWRLANPFEEEDPVAAQSLFEARVQLVLGMLIVGTSVWLLARQPMPQSSPKPFDFPFVKEPVSYPFTFWVISGIGAALIILLAFWSNPSFKFLGLRPSFKVELSNYAQLAMFLGGIFLWVVGFLYPGEQRRIFRRLHASLRDYPYEWLLVIVLTLIAFGLRLYRLDTAIPVMVSDESAYMFAGRYVVDGEPANIALDMHFGDLFLGGYLNALVFEAFGLSLFTGRVLVTIVGALAIPWVYLIARRLFNWKAAWLACLLLLTQPLHMHFSRIALYDIYDPTFCALAILLIWDGMERGGRWKFALAGALIGVSQYYYAGARLWLLLIPAWLFVMGLRYPRRILSYWPYYLILAATVMLVLFPMAAHFEATSVSPFQHAANMSHGEGELGGAFDIAPEQFFKSMSLSIRAYIDYGDATRHYDPSGKTQLNLRWALLAFVLGLVISLRYALNPGIMLMHMWMGMMLVLGGGLLRDTPGFSRYVTAMLPMATLAGIGVMWVLSYVQLWAVPRFKPLVLLIGVFLMFRINIADFHYFQSVHPTNFMADMLPNRVINDAIAKDAAEVQRNGYVPVFVFNSNGLTSDRQRLLQIYQYYCGIHCPYEEIVLSPTEEITPEWLAGLTDPQGTYVFVLPGREEPYDGSITPGSPTDLIQQAYPEVTVEQFNSERYRRPTLVRLYTRIWIPSGAVF
jgi:hypothetical protein